MAEYIDPAMDAIEDAAGAAAEKVSQKVEQNKLKDFEEEDCLSCQG
mgnify:CR=1 FL=1